MDWYRSDLGVSHGDELLTMFKQQIPFDTVYTEEDQIVSDHLVKMWTNFAETGDPSPSKDLQWKKYGFLHHFVKSSFNSFLLG